MMQAAVSNLVAGLKDDDGGVREAAANALGAIGPAAEAAVSNLVGALKDDNSGVRAAAAHALGAIGPAEAAVPNLLEACFT